MGEGDSIDAFGVAILEERAKVFVPGHSGAAGKDGLEAGGAEGDAIGDADFVGPAAGVAGGESDGAGVEGVVGVKVVIGFCEEGVRERSRYWR
jgi:hypothetical protein